MSSYEDVERRVAFVEAEMTVIRRETAEARALAQGADRDVAGLQQIMTMLKGLQGTTGS